jgi:hypothetical protein
MKTMTKERQEKYNAVEEQRNEIDEKLDEIKYLVTGYVTGDKMFDRDEQALPQRFLEVYSLRDIKQCIKDMEFSFKTKHGYGYIYDLRIEPVSKDLVDDFMKFAQSERIDSWQHIQQWKESERLKKAV